ncbi:hypothetical protein AtEden1_Chr5g0119881 [Arabidopsis thaliana]
MIYVRYTKKTWFGSGLGPVLRLTSFMIHLDIFQVFPVYIIVFRIFLSIQNSSDWFYCVLSVMKFIIYFSIPIWYFWFDYFAH